MHGEDPGRARVGRGKKEGNVPISVGITFKSLIRSYLTVWLLRKSCSSLFFFTFVVWMSVGKEWESGGSWEKGKK